VYVFSRLSHTSKSLQLPPSWERGELQRAESEKEKAMGALSITCGSPAVCLCRVHVEEDKPRLAA